MHTVTLLLLAVAAGASAEPRRELSFEPADGSGLKVVAPEGGTCKVDRGKGPAKETIPFAFTGPARSYPFWCKLPSGAPWIGTVPVRKGHTTIVRFVEPGAAAAPKLAEAEAPTPTPTPTPETAAPPEPELAAPPPVDPAAVVAGRLLSSDRRAALAKVLKDRRADVALLVASLRLLPYSSDRLALLEDVRPELPAGAVAELESLFVYAGDRRQARALLGVD